MLHSFDGKVALVTGAASGMGLATANAFASAGASVVLADINGAAAIAQAERLTREGHQAAGIRCDVSDEQQVRVMVDKVIERFKRLDAAYNNAGIQAKYAETADLTSSEFDRVVAVNLRGTWLCMKYELLQMRKQGTGTIVNCSSIGGLKGNAGRAAYSATKHGVIGLTQSAAIEYAPMGIRINAVCPGTIDTPMVEAMAEAGELSKERSAQAMPIGRLGRGEEIADTVLWLSSEASSLVVGQSIAVDGGFTIR